MNRQERIDQELQIFSTQTNRNYRFETLLQSYIAADNTWVDPFSPKMMRLLNAPRNQFIIYDKAYPITSYSYKLYGTTNLWHLVVSCSGYIHPHIIPRGHTFKVPTLATIVATMKEKEENLYGKVVVF